MHLLLHEPRSVANFVYYPIHIEIDVLLYEQLRTINCVNIVI